MTIAIWETGSEDELTGKKEESLFVYGEYLIDTGTLLRTRSSLKITADGLLIIPRESPYRSVLKEDKVVIVGLMDSFEICVP